MAHLLLNSWKGISDDSFLGRDGEALDMTDIDVRSNNRYFSVGNPLQGTLGTSTSSSATTDWITETPNGVVSCQNNTVWVGGSNKGGTVAGAYRHNYVGTDNSAYSATTNPSALRHFFFQFSSRNPIVATNYDVSSVLNTALSNIVFVVSGVTTSPTAGAVYTNNGATFTVTAVSISGGIGTITASYPSGAPLSSGTLTKSSGTGDASITYSAVYDEILNAITTATVVVANKILFARANNIYEIDTGSYVVQTSKDSNNQPVTLTYGHTVKYMYQFNDTLQVVATHNNNTYFYTYSISATATALQLIQRYKVPVIGYKCIDAIGSNGFIRWISTQGIHIFSGNNQFVKALNTIPSAQRIFSTSARMAIYKDLVTIADGTDIWEYGHILPGYPDILTRRTSINTISCVSEQWFSTGTGGTTRIETILTGSSYRQTGNIVTLPYDASIFSEVKDNLKFRLGYILPSGSYAGTQCSIVVGVQTNTMEQNNTVTYATVATISDKTKNRQTISLQEINTALNTAGVSPEWGYIRFKITLNAGNETGAIYAKTPQIFDFYLSHDNIKNDI